jgi:hypothetical protein
MLPVSYAAADVGRATKGAALALKAKAFLYLKEYSSVVSTVAEIKALGIYALQANYQDNFLDSTQNNSESVWEIQHTNLELAWGIVSTNSGRRKKYRMVTALLKWIPVFKKHLNLVIPG